MKDIQTIKNRLAAIQGNFNPQKNTYKVIEHVVNNDLSYDEMLMELSKIKGFSKYPEELKNEYVSIINDIKENIINQRKKDEREKQEANTKELKDIITSLEQRKQEYIEKLDEVVTEYPQEEKLDEKTEEKKQEKIEEKGNKQLEKVEEKKEISKPEDIEQLDKIKKVLVIGIVIVLLLIVAVLFFY